MKRYPYATVVALASLSVVEAFAAGPDTQCDDRCTVVEAVEAVSQTVTPKILLTGGIEPKFQSNVAFRVSGKISQRLVEIGDHVGADQVLAKLDPREQAANLDTAKAALASGEALLTQATVAFQRQATLFKTGYTTRPSYDQAEQQLRTQTAVVESAKAALGSAREQFGYTDLRAGVAGIVTARAAEAGQVIQAGTTVFTLAQDGPRDAVFNVYEALLTDPPGSKIVEVALQSDPNVKTTGTVREISPTVDTASGTVKVKVGLVSVPAGMSLGAAVVGSGQFKPRTATVLPRSALYRWDDAPAVWTIDPKTHAVRPKAIAIARFEGESLILSGGVAPGDMVVSAGIQFLHPGQVVEISKTRREK